MNSKNSSELVNGTSILAIPQEDAGAKDSRIETTGEFDLESELSGLVTSIKIAEKSTRELEKSIRELNREKTELLESKADAEFELLELMLEWDIPEYFIGGYRLSLEKSIYLDVLDESVVPEKYRRWSFEVNKKLIHRLCKKGKKILRRTPRGTSFKKRDFVKISKY